MQIAVIQEPDRAKRATTCPPASYRGPGYYIFENGSGKIRAWTVWSDVTGTFHLSNQSEGGFLHGEISIPAFEAKVSKLHHGNLAADLARGYALAA